MKTLIELFEIKKCDVISIVGTGGKTTLLFKLGKELKNKYKVLLTTSTKIYKPDKEDYDFIYTCMDDYLNDNIDVNIGATVLSKKFNTENQKLIGLDDSDFELIVNDFDVFLIESDGSRKLPLKGWKNQEPPILKSTNKTIGVFPIDMLGEKISHDKIYAYENFLFFSGNKDIVDMETVGKICSDKNGIFKNSRGKLYFYINRVDDEKSLKKAMELAKYLKTNIAGKPFDFKICIGSLKEGMFYEY